MPLYKPSSPSMGLMRKIFGDPMSESTQKDYPELARAWASAQINMPRETSNVNSIVANIKNPDYLGRYTPGLGEIDINKEATTQDNNLRKTLVHEITHANQPMTFRKLWEKQLPWDKRQEEIEANKMGDINPIKERGSDINLTSRDGDRRDTRLPENYTTYTPYTSRIDMSPKKRAELTTKFKR